MKTEPRLKEKIKRKHLIILVLLVAGIAMTILTPALADLISGDSGSDLVAVVSDQTDSDDIVTELDSLGINYDLYTPSEAGNIDLSNYDLLISNNGATGVPNKDGSTVRNWIREGNGYIDYTYSEGTGDEYDINVDGGPDSPNHTWLDLDHPLYRILNYDPCIGSRSSSWADAWFTGGSDLSSFNSVVEHNGYPTIMTKKEGAGRVILSGSTPQRGGGTELIENMIWWALHHHGTRIGKEPSEPTGKVLDMGFNAKNSTHVFDTSGNENHGLIQGPEQKTAVHCKVGRCYSFDGSDDEVDISSSPSLLSLNDTNEMTVSLWFNLKQNKQETFLATYSDEIRIGLNSEDTFMVNWGTHTDYTYNYDLKTGRWYHVTITKNSTGNGVLYVDGKEVAAESGLANINLGDNTPLVGIGYEIWEGTNFKYTNGKIDQVKIYDRALSQKEIIQNTRGLSSSGAVLDMRLDAGGGDLAYDNSIHNNNGRLKPNESYGPTWTDGIQGNALNFDGSDDYVNITSSPSINSPASTDKITLTAWIKNAGNNAGGKVIDRWGGTCNSYQLMIDTGPALRIAVAGDGDTAPQNLQETSGWTFVAGVYDGSQVKFYENGESRGEVSESGGIAGCEMPVGIGARYGGGANFYNGKIDDVRIYPYTLSKSKIKQLYNDGASRIGNSSRAPQDPGREGLVLKQSLDRVERCADLHENFEHYSISDGSSIPVNSDWVTDQLALEYDTEQVADGSFSAYTTSLSGVTCPLMHKKIFSEGRKVTQFIGWYRETSNSHGHGVTLRDSNKNRVLGWYTNNPEFGVYDANGFHGGQNSGSLISGLSYDTWYRVSVTINWDTMNFTVVHSAEPNTVFGPYELNGNNIQYLYVENADDEVNRPWNCGGGNVDSWVDDFTIRAQSYGRVTCPSRMDGKIAVDGSGQANHGELMNGPVEKSGAECKLGECLKFDGNDDYEVISHKNQLNGETGLSLSFWIYWQEDPSAKDGADDIIAKRRGSTTSQSWTLQFSDWNLNHGGTWNSATHALQENWIQGSWQHTVISWDNSSNQMKIYLNGKLINNKILSSLMPDGDADIHIGHFTGAGSYDSMKLDEVRIYGRSLSKEEIWHLYTQGRDQRGRGEKGGPVGWWRMDDEPEHKPVVIYDDTPQLYYVKNYENGTFGSLESFGSSYSMENDDGVAMADFTGNGVYDIMFYGNNHKIYLWENIEDGPPSGSPKHIATLGGSKSQGFDPGDWDEDGDIDVIENQDGDYIENLGDGGWNTYSLSFSGDRVLVGADFDEDGCEDAVYDAGSEVAFRPGQCDGTFGAKSTILSAPGNNNYLAEGDFDNDGHMDFILGDEGDDGELDLYTGNGDGTFNLANENFTSGIGVDHANPVASDLDNDGDEDIIACEHDDNNLWYIEGYGDGTFGSTQKLANTGASCLGSSAPSNDYAQGVAEENDGKRIGPPEWVDGKVGKALDFDGSDDYVEVSSQVMPSGDFTICAWATIDDPTTDRTIAGNVDCNNDKGAHLDVAQGDWKFLLRDGGNVGIRGTTAEAGETQFVCGVFDSGTATLYENAKQTAQQSGINYQQPTASNFLIGLESNGCGWNNYWDGTIDEVRIYPYALTHDQVKSVYNQGAAEVG